MRIDGVSSSFTEIENQSWRVVMQPGTRRQLALTCKWAQRLEQAEQLEAIIRAKVEHPFHVIKKSMSAHEGPL